jgi:mannose-6-phosphate isomerase-like protein (cupin superfamily)
MRHIHTGKHKSLFEPLIASPSVQAAMMTLKPGQASSDRPENEHPRAEQWLYVISGAGRAKFQAGAAHPAREKSSGTAKSSTRSRSIAIKTGSLLLIEKGESHQIVNTGAQTMTTINFYAQPAYDQQGEVKAAVSKSR